MRSFSIVMVLLMMIVGDKGYGCDWLRTKQVYNPGVVYVVNPYPVAYPVYNVQPQPQLVPVVTYHQVTFPVVEQRVQWVWPYYVVPQPVVRPVWIQY